MSLILTLGMTSFAFAYHSLLTTSDYYVAMAIASEIGDVTRFPSAKNLVSWFVAIGTCSISEPDRQSTSLVVPSGEDVCGLGAVYAEYTSLLVE